MSSESILHVSELEPTSIVRDFGLYVKFLSNKLVALTPKNQYLNKATLYQINKQMTTYVTEDNPNYNQHSYPLLNLFYHLALEGKLFHKVQAKGDRFELQPTNRSISYQDLTLVEKYFFLLETLWIDVDWKELNPANTQDEAELNIGEVFKFVSNQKPDKGIKVSVANHEILKDVLDSLNRHILTLSFFGFWEVAKDETSAGILYSKYDFRVTTFTPSKFGVVMAVFLATERNLPYWNVPSRRKYGEERVIPGSPLPRRNKYLLIQDMIEEYDEGKLVEKEKMIDQAYKEETFILPFIDFFASGELKTSLARKQATFDGNYTFKISFSKRIWQRVVLSSQHTLKDMHMIIQEAFELNDDHLYCFFMDNKAWSHNSYNCPDDDKGPYVTEARIGDLGLEQDQEILYLFDYGNEFKLKVRLENVDEVGSKVLKPVVIERHGASPVQHHF